MNICGNAWMGQMGQTKGPTSFFWDATIAWGPRPRRPHIYLGMPVGMPRCVYVCSTTSLQGMPGGLPGVPIQGPHELLGHASGNAGVYGRGPHEILGGRNGPRPGGVAEGYFRDKGMQTGMPRALIQGPHELLVNAGGNDGVSDRGPHELWGAERGECQGA